jgi:hypothetical protein
MLNTLYSVFEKVNETSGEQEISQYFLNYISVDFSLKVKFDAARVIKNVDTMLISLLAYCR